MPDGHFVDVFYYEHENKNSDNVLVSCVDSKISR